MATVKKTKATPRQLAALKKAKAAKTDRLKTKSSLGGSASRADVSTLESALWQLGYCDHETLGRYCRFELPNAQLKKIYLAIYKDLDKDEQKKVRQYL